MEKKYLQRNSIRSSFVKMVNQLDRELEEADADADDFNHLKVLWRRVEDRFLNLEKLDNDIWDELVAGDITQAEMSNEFNDVQDYRDKWIEINCKMDVIFQDNQSAVRSTVEPQTDQSVGRLTGEPKSYKLPKLKLVEFDGNPRDWLGFWSQFKTIHDDKSLSGEVKFQYLIQATAVGSAAKRVVTSFPPTKENFPKAIQHLKSRLGKEKVLIEVYVRDLLKLVLSNANGQQTLNLATLYDQLETQLRSLESLGVTSDKYAAMLYPLVESSLSEEVLRTWERIRNQRWDRAHKIW